MSHLLKPLLRRLVSFLMGAGLLGYGLWVALGLSDVVPRSPFVVSELNIFLDPWSVPLVWAISLAAAAMLLGAGLCLLALSPDRIERDRRGDWVVLVDGREQGLGGARVSLSRESLEALLVHEAMRVEGVHSVRPVLRQDAAGWQVRCVVQLWTDRPTVEIAAELEARLPEAIRRHTGIPIDDLNLDLVYAASRARVA